MSQKFDIDSKVNNTYTKDTTKKWVLRYFVQLNSLFRLDRLIKSSKKKIKQRQLAREQFRREKIKQLIDFNTCKA